MTLVDAKSALGEPIVKMPTAGGSLLLFIFDRILQTPLIIGPMVNHDNNQRKSADSEFVGWHRNVRVDSGAFRTGLGISLFLHSS
ncbi:MAG: hypothetical protein V3R41_03855, partial [Gammaproteobacteria bacterium]